MTKNILFSNKMLVLLRKYTKKGETHTYPLAFPPFWAYPMSCFETILFRHSGFPGTASAPGAPCPSLFGGRKMRAIPYAALGANVLLSPLLQRPPGVQERLQQNGAVIHRHAARLFDPEGFLL